MRPIVKGCEWSLTAITHGQNLAVVGGSHEQTSLEVRIM
jgi:hypothetical protein